jgi:hypothetical protein
MIDYVAKISGTVLRIETGDPFFTVGGCGYHDVANYTPVKIVDGPADVEMPKIKARGCGEAH